MRLLLKSRFAYSCTNELSIFFSILSKRRNGGYIYTPYEKKSFSPAEYTSPYPSCETYELIRFRNIKNHKQHLTALKYTLYISGEALPLRGNKKASLKALQITRRSHSKVALEDRTRTPRLQPDHEPRARRRPALAASTRTQAHTIAARPPVRPRPDRPTPREILRSFRRRRREYSLFTFRPPGALARGGYAA